jgi:hypothetical protein
MQIFTSLEDLSLLGVLIVAEHGHRLQHLGISISMNTGAVAHGSYAGSSRSVSESLLGADRCHSVERVGPSFVRMDFKWR